MWLDGVVAALGDNWTEQDLKTYVWNTLKSGVVSNSMSCTVCKICVKSSHHLFILLIILQKYGMVLQCKQIVIKTSVIESDQSLL